MKREHKELIRAHLATGMKTPKQRDICKAMGIQQPDFYRVVYKALKEEAHENAK